MSRALKSKLILSGLSLLVLVLIPLLENNFYAPVKIIRWRELTWDDFQGLARPFTGWGAGIYSTIYLEFDSAKAEYSSYAAMNNQVSWTKKSSIGSDYMLNHEQYHFNLTEYHSRLLNHIIRKENLKQKDEANTKLSDLVWQLRSFQEKYDGETDHGVNQGLQRMWEFKIDSLLNLFSLDSGYVTDYHTRAKVFLPTKVDFTYDTIEQLATYRLYSTERYDMNITMTSYEYFERDFGDLTSSIYGVYERDSLIVRSFQVDSSFYQYNALTETYDSISDKVTMQRWVDNGDFLYRLSAKYSVDSDSVGYRRIANSFLNSFRIAEFIPQKPKPSHQ